MKKSGSTRSLNGSKAIAATAKPLCPEIANSCVQIKDLDAIAKSQNLAKKHLAIGCDGTRRPSDAFYTRANCAFCAGITGRFDRCYFSCASAADTGMHEICRAGELLTRKARHTKNDITKPRACSTN